MKRRSKFKAWDNELKQWYKPTHEAYKGNLFELLVGFSGDLSAHTMQGMIHESMWPDRFELVEFTGLHDKNGVEIYEGDIVNCYDHPTDMESGIFEIGFHSGTFVCKGSAILLRDFGTAWTKVVGNIYENPELL